MARVLNVTSQIKGRKVTQPDPIHFLNNFNMEVMNRSAEEQAAKNVFTL